MLNIRAIIFDFDGVLVDSLSIWKRINYVVFAILGLPLDSVEDFEREVCGMSKEAVAQYYIDKYGVKRSINEIANLILNTAVQNFRSVVKLKDGVTDFIEYISEKGIKMAIASSSEQIIINECLEANRFETYFETVVTSSEVKRHKPYPDVYLKAAEKLGVLPSECLVFEDMLNGVLAGKGAGMTVFGMYDCFSEYQIDEIKKNCDEYFINFYEVKEFIELKGELYEKGFRKRA